MKLLAGAACVVVWMSVLVGGAQSAPTPFQLVFDGHHVVADFPSPTGLAHAGPFTTNSSLCPSGNARDVAQTDQVATRLFTCTGSNATFTATISPHLAEHGGTGSWRITGGTGALTDFRGKGTFTGVLTNGSPSDLQSITFRSTWQGVVDLDASPPTLSLSKQTARRVTRPAGSYLLHLVISLGDDGGNPVSYALSLVDPTSLSALFRKSGRTSSGTLSLACTVRPSSRARSLRLEIEASDPVGNESSLRRAVRLR
jgi:hypothetical protein